ncbi:beta-N-acetylhexosaminidase [Alkalispirochaeta americana]|uniref:beta-N-acetylhexosaminidase n=1 Tax=Alkalispirochaeta americana TaxID=159291 RepID=A0A1N6RZ30_9SPIO|nr:glycoside hydrolase family 3 protein [Alkalispirochaeta americana]SIQ33946.1 beta-N-acetylhexosaminidase [Alkalispirochaeta americana]
MNLFSRNCVFFCVHLCTLSTIVALLSLGLVACATPGPEGSPGEALPKELPRESRGGPPGAEADDLLPPGGAGSAVAGAGLLLDDALRERAVQDMLSRMTLEERVGQLFMPALVVDSRGAPLVELDEATRAMIGTVQPGGVILFGANLRDPDQTRRLVEDLQEASPIPLLVAVDQEGGIVSRLNSSTRMPATAIPSAWRIGLTGSEELAYAIAGAMARELRSLGITMNFAPVADILTNPENPVIGSRAFGSDPHLVARMVAATVRGLQDNGVSAVIKHFPGHGDTREDTHYQSVIVDHDLERLRTLEFIPFREGITAGAEGVMTAHISLPRVVGDDTPATLSPEVLQGMLRKDLGYSGLIVTDSLVMKALDRFAPPDERPLRAFQAGADLLLYPLSPEGSFRRILRALEEGEIPEDALNRAVGRILRVKFERGLLGPPGDPSRESPEGRFSRPVRFVPEAVEMGTPEHLQLVEEVYRRTS